MDRKGGGRWEGVEVAEDRAQGQADSAASGAEPWGAIKREFVIYCLVKYLLN